MKRIQTQCTVAARSFHRSTTRIAACALIVMVSPATQSPADSPEADPQPPVEYDAFRLDGNAMNLSVQGHQSLRVPRVYAPLQSITEGPVSTESKPLAPSVAKLIPEVNHWRIELGPATSIDELSLHFDPAYEASLQPITIRPRGDGTFVLPACLGRPVGEKLRYEPQPHKNTIGYWTVATDRVSWPTADIAAGIYNVAVLYGCGKDQGGQAELSWGDGSDQRSKLGFEVRPTGHFQNFRWHDLGTIQVADLNDASLTVVAKSIHRTALMDIREIQLSIAR